MAITTAAAIIGGAIIGAGASMASGSRQAGAIRGSARTAAEAELQMYEQSRADLGPYRERGYQALDALSQLYGLGPTAASASPTYQPTPGGGVSGILGRGGIEPSDLGTGVMSSGGPAAEPGSSPIGTGAATGGRDLSAFYASPNYTFVRDEGLSGIGNSYAARGMGQSGPSARAAGSFASNLASGEFNNYVNRLASIAGIGQSATNTTANLGAGTASSLANIYTASGANRASTYGQVGAGVNSAIQGGLQNWLFNSYLNNQTTSPSGAPFGN